MAYLYPNVREIAASVTIKQVICIVDTNLHSGHELFTNVDFAQHLLKRFKT